MVPDYSLLCIYSPGTLNNNTIIFFLIGVLLFYLHMFLAFNNLHSDIYVR